jgi:hypothetical protein
MTLYTTTSSDSSTTGVRDIDPNGAVRQLWYSAGIEHCVYAPAYRTAPARGAPIGSTYSVSTEATCVGNSKFPESRTGIVEGLERVTSPAGVFDAIKYTTTQVSTSDGSTFTTRETCWTDIKTGFDVRCDTLFTVTKAGSPTAQPISTTTTTVLQSYAFNGQPTVNPSSLRHAGLWTIASNDDRPFECARFLVREDGGFGAECSSRRANGENTFFRIAGTIDASGAVVATGSDASFSGTLKSPISGAGSWKSGSLSGTWRAYHL